jgi:hypothetical protein
MDHHATPTPPDATLVERVRKLLAKAEATGNAHEAEVFARKAAELIARHRIDPYHLAAGPRSGELAVRRIPLGRGAYVRARLSLLMAVASANDVRVVFEAGPAGTTALAAGFVEDLDLVEMLYTSLHQQASSEMAGIRRSTGAATTRYRRSFLFGFAERIGQLLAEAADTADAETAATSDRDRTALARRERTAVVDDFTDRSFGRVQRARPARAAQPGAWAAGSAAADGADVGRGRIPGRRALGSG